MYRGYDGASFVFLSGIKKMKSRKWAVKRLTINLTAQEATVLESFCQRTGRPFTDVIRELIRGLVLREESQP
jgi:DNA-binding response OmpR family regulator